MTTNETFSLSNLYLTDNAGLLVFGNLLDDNSVSLRVWQNCQSYAINFATAKQVQDVISALTEALDKLNSKELDNAIN